MLGEFGFKASYSLKEIPSLAQNGYLRQLRTNIFFMPRAALISIINLAHQGLE